jgi:PTH1 family peptidyl-tRNA hydrolase
MRFIVGLGNPDERYQYTRHNLGFWVCEALLRELAPLEKTTWRVNKQLQAEIAKIDDLVLAKLLTAMNASGVAVKKLITNYRLLMADLWIIHDDLDLPLGKIKIVKGRGAAGHRGVESVIEQLQTKDFVRFRLGIGPSRGDPVDFVLTEFERKERIEADRMVKKAVELIQFALKKGIEAAMNRYHQ